MIPALIAQALHKDVITLGNLSPTRDFTFVSDTVNGFINVAESEACIGQEVNLGTGTEISIGELALKIIKLVGRDVNVQSASERMRPATSEVQRLCSDNAKARELAGWSPKVSLDEGLQATLNWIKKESSAYDPDHYRV